MFLGLAALTLGILVYVLDRPSGAVYFVPDSWRIADTTPLFFGKVGNYLPAFLHVLAFALFSAAIAGRRYVGLICTGWFIAEVFFELAQMDPVASQIASMLPGWFAGSPLLENISSHFLTGRFDAFDVLFLLLGCITAFIIGYLVLPLRQKGQQPSGLASSRPARLAALLLVAFIGLTSILGSGGTGNGYIAAVAESTTALR